MNMEGEWVVGVDYQDTATYHMPYWSDPNQPATMTWARNLGLPGCFQKLTVGDR
jgi:hypothetical protein